MDINIPKIKLPRLKPIVINCIICKKRIIPFNNLFYHKTCVEFCNIFKKSI